MIKKVIKSIKKVFIPRSEFLIEEKPKKVEKPKENYIGVAAPVSVPFDSWFSKPVKSEKVIAYEKHVAQKIEEQRFIEATQPKKEPKNIHQKMYEMATRSGNTTLQLNPIGGSENFQGGSENFHER